jgi:hypothetical protein
LCPFLDSRWLESVQLTWKYNTPDSGHEGNDFALLLSFLCVYGELLFRQAAWHALLHPFLHVVDLKRALNFGEAQGFVPWLWVGFFLRSESAGCTIVTIEQPSPD